MAEQEGEVTGLEWGQRAAGRGGEGREAALSVKARDAILPPLKTFLFVTLAGKKYNLRGYTGRADSTPGKMTGQERPRAGPRWSPLVPRWSPV